MKEQTIRILIYILEQRIKRRIIHRFFRPNCEYCKYESEILQELKEELTSQSKSNKGGKK